MIWISPHFDDAVLSAGEQVAVDPTALVVTVFGGRPGPKPVTAYDVRSGFRDGDEAVTERMIEDRQALAVLGAQQFYLGFADGQYARDDRDLLHEHLAEMIRMYAPHHGDIACPVGLLHDDHVAVTDAVLAVVVRMKGRRLFLWEDLPARVTHPETVEARITDLEQDYGLGFFARHPTYDGGFLTDIKEVAIRCYRSQTKPQVGLPWRAALVPERLWEVTWQ